MSEAELYKLLEDRIKTMEKGIEEGIIQFNERYPILEKIAFGEIDEICANPLAMKYDMVRNVLIGYAGKEDARTKALEAKELLLGIPKPPNI